MGLIKKISTVTLSFILGAGIMRGVDVINYNSNLDKKINHLEEMQRYYGTKAVSYNLNFRDLFHNDILPLDDPSIREIGKKAEDFQKKADSYQPKIDSLENEKISYLDF